MLELGWDIGDVNIIDLFAENRIETNGLRLQAGNSSLGALAWRGLTRIGVAVKDAMRDLIMGQESYSSEQQIDIMDYCASDVEGLDVLLRAMLPKVDLPRALFRGRYTKAAARMERAGVPIDTDALGLLVAKWQGIRRELIKHIDQDYGVYQGGTFKRGRFVEYLRRHRIPWPKSDTGQLKLDGETFEVQATLWPILAPLHDLRQALGRMYLPDLQVGRDGRCRTLIGPFSSKTGRNQPSTRKFAVCIVQMAAVRDQAPERLGH